MNKRGLIRDAAERTADQAFIQLQAELLRVLLAAAGRTPTALAAIAEHCRDFRGDRLAMPPVDGLSDEEMSEANQVFRVAIAVRVSELLAKLGA